MKRGSGGEIGVATMTSARESRRCAPTPVKSVECAQAGVSGMKPDWALTGTAEVMQQSAGDLLAGGDFGQHGWAVGSFVTAMAAHRPLTFRSRSAASRIPNPSLDLACIRLARLHARRTPRFLGATFHTSSWQRTTSCGSRSGLNDAPNGAIVGLELANSDHLSRPEGCRERRAYILVGSDG